MGSTLEVVIRIYTAAFYTQKMRERRSFFLELSGEPGVALQGYWLNYNSIHPIDLAPLIAVTRHVLLQNPEHALISTPNRNMEQHYMYVNRRRAPG